MRRTSERLTYANVASTLALVIAVGGGGAAVAATLANNSVGSPQVIDGSLKARDLSSNSVTGPKIKDGSIGHSDLTSGAIGVVRGYAWVNDPTTPVGAAQALTNGYVYNSAGGGVSVTRLGAGTYQVEFAGLDFLPGNVQVTGYGGSPNYCKVSSWGSNLANIRCYDPAGAPTDTQFSLAVIE